VVPTTSDLALGNGHANTHYAHDGGRRAHRHRCRQTERDSDAEFAELLHELHQPAAAHVRSRQEHRSVRRRDGSGAYQIHFAAYTPRYGSSAHKGQCDTASNAQPLANGAVTTFLAAGVLTVG